jgi:DNA-binding GntR family transcriptional regulator
MLTKGQANTLTKELTSLIDAYQEQHGTEARKSELPNERVEADLRRRIAADEWDHGDALPTVTELADAYGVGRGTVARVLRRLADDDPPLVVIRERWGTFRA